MLRIATFFGLGFLALVACGGATDDGASEDNDLRHRADAGGAPATLPPMTSGTIFTIVMENHDYVEVVGSPNAPYLNSLIAEYGLATNYMDADIHPSLPNYLTMISGAPQYPGGEDKDPTAAPFPVTAQNLGTQMEAAHIPWRSYQESMGTACKLTDQGNFAPRHDPFLYFTDMQKGPNGLCAARNVDYAQFPADLASGSYKYMWITPNLLDDGHNPYNSPVTGLKQTDHWASVEIPKIIASEAFKNGGVIFLTWDEAEGRGTDNKEQIPMIVITPRLPHAAFTSAKAYSHRSYLATVEDLLGVPRLSTVAGEAAMTDFFAQ